MNRVTQSLSTLALISVLSIGAHSSVRGQSASNDVKPFTKEAFSAAAAEGKRSWSSFTRHGVRSAGRRSQRSRRG
jgi:hypothetical protein